MDYYRMICLRYPCCAHIWTHLSAWFVCLAAFCLLTCCWGKAFDSYFHFWSKIWDAEPNSQICVMLLLLSIRKMFDTVFSCSKSIFSSSVHLQCSRCVAQRAALIGETDRKPQQYFSQSDAPMLQAVPYWLLFKKKKGMNSVRVPLTFSQTDVDS